MNWDQVEGQWKQRRGKATRHWGKLMNDELADIGGEYEQLVGRLQEKYGIAKGEAKRQIDEFKKIVKQLRKSNRTLIKSQKSPRKRAKLDKKPVDLKRAAGKRRTQTRMGVRS